ncbi:MAG: GumC family protein [Kiritimatiellia bacterium]
MADKPLYYGSSKGTPMYYGGHQPVYGGKQPMYYGAGRPYGRYGAYGSYGSYGGDGQGEDGSVIGTLTLSRMLRVIAQRWLSVFVFLLVGLVIAFTIYRISPTIYEAASEFTMDIRHATGSRQSAIDLSAPDLGNNYTEIFNTRLPSWRSEKIVTTIVQEYRSNHPASTVPDEEIISTIAGSELELQRNSRIIRITVRSRSAQLAADLANAYAKAIENLTDEENKIRCDKAVSQIHANVEKKRREVETISQKLLDFRTANKVDNLRSSRETTQQSLAKTTGDILALEGEETQLVAWEKLLQTVKDDPERFGALSTSVPRAQEISTEYRAFQDASGDYQKLLFTFTENHPDVMAKAKELEIAKQRFIDATQRALETGRSTLQVARNRLANLRAKREDLKSELVSLEQRIVLAESGLKILETDYGVASDVHKGLILDENKARLDAEANNEIITLGRQASAPQKPVLPSAPVIFGAGVVLSLVLGLLFVLILDNFEDTIVNLSDIESRLALKVLAVLPHVRRKRRMEVAKFVASDKYSQFSESVAGFRNLLDSPRYETMNRSILFISTQPGEGKTITSTSVAISYAQAGRRVLHVDFDLRRPRLANIWGLALTEETSLSHTLQNSGGKVPDFSKLINRSSVKGLDIIGSLPPEGISPSTILGLSVVADFFAWARANYDRVIIDSPPFGIVGDVVSLAVMVDSVLIMCCPDRTHFKPIQFCTRCLTEAGANILGVIVNDVEIGGMVAFSPAHHHSYGKYGYGYGGYGYGYSPAKRKKSAEANGAAPKGTEAEKAASASSRAAVRDEFTDED